MGKEKHTSALSGYAQRGVEAFDGVVRTVYESAVPEDLPAAPKEPSASSGEASVLDSNSDKKLSACREIWAETVSICVTTTVRAQSFGGVEKACADPKVFPTQNGELVGADTLQEAFVSGVTDDGRPAVRFGLCNEGERTVVNSVKRRAFDGIGWKNVISGDHANTLRKEPLLVDLVIPGQGSSYTTDDGSKVFTLCGEDRSS